MPGFLQKAAALANPVWEALATTQAHFNCGDERLRYFPEDVAPFAGLPNWDEADLQFLTRHLPAGRRFFLLQEKAVEIPDEFEVILQLPLYQMIATGAVMQVDGPGIRPLGREDVPRMVALTRMTRPGPFAENTIDFGNYVGIFEGEKLIAMGGERLRVPGYAEVSAICTDPDYRGRNLATGVLAHVAQGIIDRGEIPFLHTKTDNAAAIRVYEKIGFEYNREIFFAIIVRR